LPEFALTHEEIESLGPQNAVRLLGRAAQVIYNTATASADSRAMRGEIGEILLHIAIRQVFQSSPAVSKFYFKDSANNTVKGFDAVHVVENGSELELWTGEVKFYKDIGRAISDVAAEIDEHLATDYLRSEFALIENKISKAWPHYDAIKKLLDPNTSLDDVFSCMVIPVFLTYESGVIGSHKKVSEQFCTDLKAELLANQKKFAKRNLPKHVRIHAFMLPMHTKQALVDAFDKRLTACQQMTS
jgi:hypothetical protein